MSSRSAVAIPGRIGGPYTPTIVFASDAAENRGAEIHHLWWTIDRDPVELSGPQRLEWVDNQVRPIVDKLERPLLIAKSLGSHCARLAAELELPAVWITPLKASGLWYGDYVQEGLRSATAPCLLIGGTADASWDRELARELSPYVFEVEGADHGLRVPGPLAASAAALGEMATAVERFLDEVVWPK